MVDWIDLGHVSNVQAALSVVFGGLVGVLLGLVGGGGSILTVPILVYVIGLDVQAATATSLVVVGASALAGAVPHARAGRVNPRVAALFGLVGIVGAFLGSWLNRFISGSWLLTMFGVLMIAVAARLWLGAASGAAAHRAPEPGKNLDWKVPAVGLAVGILTGFFGVGGGFLIVPALALTLGIPIAVAVGTSLAIIAINSASGLAAHLGSGVDVPVALLFIAGGVLGGVAGGRWCGRLDARALSRSFALLVGAVGAYLVVRNGLLIAGGPL
jgi:uncharacterized membrane protein YfcA